MQNIYYVQNIGLTTPKCLMFMFLSPQYFGLCIICMYLKWNLSVIAALCWTLSTTTPEFRVSRGLWLPPLVALINVFNFLSLQKLWLVRLRLLMMVLKFHWRGKRVHISKHSMSQTRENSARYIRVNLSHLLATFKIILLGSEREHKSQSGFELIYLHCPLL